MKDRGASEPFLGHHQVPFIYDFPSAEFYEESFGNKLNLLLKDPNIFLLKILILTFAP
jgi:hypothetical protein